MGGEFLGFLSNGLEPKWRQETIELKEAAGYTYIGNGNVFTYLILRGGYPPKDSGKIIYIIGRGLKPLPGKQSFEIPLF